jgi:DDE_Tnp_1-associated
LDAGSPASPFASASCGAFPAARSASLRAASCLLACSSSVTRPHLGIVLNFLRRFLPYERGLPAHDTLNDVINGLDAELFKTCFANWVEALRDRAPDIIAIDGKTSRRRCRRSANSRVTAVL